MPALDSVSPPHFPQRNGPGVQCEELTTYETREVVAVPNSRSMGGV
jgi:hypothetical protein